MLRSRPIAVATVLALAGCGGAQRPSDLSPPLEPFAWMLGDWRNAHNATSVVAAPGAIYLVSFTDIAFNFDVKLLEATAAGVVLFHPMDGRAPDLAANVRPSKATFVGPDGSTTTLSHYPRMRFDDGTVSDSLLYSAGEALVAQLRPFRAAPAPDVERADIDLAKAARDHGAVGWAAGFADSGAIWTPTDGWVRGRAAVELALTDTTKTFSWEPTTSRLAPDGNLALTAGRFTTRTSRGEVTRGAYLTIWKLMPQHQWRVVFSTRQSGSRIPSNPS